MQKLIDILGQENNQIREVLQRNNIEQCRLMDDKRELEDLIEKLNNNINYHKQTQASILFSHGKRAASPSDSLHMPKQSQDLMEQILAEKESYIGKLEQEITEMRKEIDTQRDQFIMNDMGTLNETTTRGGTQY